MVETIGKVILVNNSTEELNALPGNYFHQGFGFEFPGLLWGRVAPNSSKILVKTVTEMFIFTAINMTRNIF